MNELAQRDVADHLLAMFASARVVEADGDLFFFEGNEEMLPFATIVTKDREFDNKSKLDRPDTFRLSLGVGKNTFLELFPQIEGKADESILSTFDHTATDKIQPNPIYFRQRWVCVLNPTRETLQRLEPLIRESYALQVARAAQRAAGVSKQTR